MHSKPNDTPNASITVPAGVLVTSIGAAGAGNPIWLDKSHSKIIIEWLHEKRDDR